MPFPLFSIPEHIRSSTIHKLNLRDFLNFHKSSRKSFDAATQIKRRFLVSSELQGKSVTLWAKNSEEGIVFNLYFDKSDRYVDFPNLFGKTSFLINDFPLRFDLFALHIEGTLTDEFCIRLMNLLLHTNSSAQCITFWNFDCTRKLFSHLLDTIKSNRIEWDHGAPMDFLTIDRIENASFLGIGTPLKDAELLPLNVISLYVFDTFITSKGINVFLKEMIEGKRRVTDGSITTMDRFDEQAVLQGMPKIFLRTSTFGQDYHFGKNNEYAIRIRPNQVLFGIIRN